MRKCSFRHVEVAVDICFERSIPLLLGEIFQIGLMLLKGCVIHQNVELAKLLERLGDQVSTDSWLCDVPQHRERLSSFCLNRTLSLFCISLLWFKICESHVGAFARKQHSHRSSNARITAGDKSDFLI